MPCGDKSSIFFDSLACLQWRRTMDTRCMAHEIVAKIRSDFLGEHPEYQATCKVPLLSKLLESAYEEVVQGRYVGKNEDQLRNESELTGLMRNHYLDLVNLTVHAASNLPLPDER
jgi:hypothetical protein